MVEVAIDVCLRCVADLGKVAYHTVRIKFGCLNGDRGLNGVSMKVTTLSAVIHQAVAITEVNLFGDCVH